MRYLLILSLLLCNCFSFAQEKSSFVKKLPVPHKAVNDFGRFLTSSEKTTLEMELKSYLKRTSNAIVIVTLDSLTDPKTKQEYTVEEAASLYFNTWGVGDKEKNNGVMLMISRDPRRVRIQVGTGLESILSNAGCQQIVDNNLVPNFKKGLFYTGLKEAINAIENRLDHPATTDQQQAVAPYLQPTIVNRETVAEPYKKKSPVIGFSIIGGILLVCILYLKYGKPLSNGWFTRNGYTTNDWTLFNSHSSHPYYGSSGGGSSGSSSGGGSYGGGGSSGGGASGRW